MYVVMGIAMAIIALGYFLLKKLAIALTYGDFMALTIAGTGVALSAISQIYIKLRKQRDQDLIETMRDYTRLVDFVDAWEIFEDSAIGITGEGSGGDTLRQNTLLSQLYDVGQITVADMVVLEEIQAARDAVMHGRTGISAEFGEEALKVLRRVTARLLSPNRETR